MIAIESWLQLGAFFEYYTLHYETLSNIAYMSGTLWGVSLEACVAARTCLPVDSPRETAAGAVPPATGGTGHGTAAVDPSNIAATTTGYRNKYISPPHIHMLQENWK